MATGRFVLVHALLLSLGSQGCAAVSTEQQVLRGTPSQTTIALGPPLLVTHDVQGDSLAVAVSPGQCQQETTTEVVTSDRISRKPTALGTLTFVGAGAGLGGLGYLAWNRADDLPAECASTMTDEECTTRDEQRVLAGLLWAGGAALAGYGVYDLLRGERDVSQKETGRRKEVDRGKPEPCRVAVAGKEVVLRLPDGTAVRGATDAGGTARLAIPESFLQSASAGGRPQLLVEGRPAEPPDLSGLVARYRRQHPVRVVLGERESQFLLSEQGKFLAASPPAVSDSSRAPRVTDVRATQTLINGGAAFIELEVADADGESDVDRLVVVTEGDSGYHLIPSSPTEAGRRSIRLGIRDSVEAGSLRVAFAAMDREGLVGQYVYRSFPIKHTGTGDLKISLTFDRETDLDLHVVEPSEEPIFFGKRYSRSGGELDLDSNAGCNVDGVNNENVYWQTGTAPAGEYKVYVHHFKPCTKEPVKYLVTVYNGRNVQTYEGTLTKDQRRAQLVTSFRRDAAPAPSVAASR